MASMIESVSRQTNLLKLPTRASTLFSKCGVSTDCYRRFSRRDENKDSSLVSNSLDVGNMLP